MSEKLTKYSLYKDVFTTWATNQMNNTTGKYTSVINPCLKKSCDLFGNKQIGMIDVNDINAFFEHLDELGLTAYTCYPYYRILDNFFAYLEDIGIIEKNPCTLFYGQKYRIRSKIKAVNVLSINEIVKISKRLNGTPYENLFEIILYTGQNVNNVLMLTWNDVDFERHIIKIKDRQLEVDEKVIEFFLKELKKQYTFRHSVDKWRNPLNMIFTDRIGKQLDYGSFNRFLTAVGNELNIIGLKSDCIVDYYIITALKSNISPKTICDQLGYSTIGRIKEHIKIANITDYGITVGENVSLTDTLYERYIKNV